MIQISRLALATAVLMLMAGCASQHHRAPVEERGRSGSAGSSSAATAPTPKPPPGAENAGKPGYYTVVKGDTLIRIGLDTGQNYKDIATWNGLENPDRIEVGQVLRVVPPGADTAVPVVAKPVTIPKVEARSLESKPASAAAAASAAASAPASKPSAAASTPASGASVAAAASAVASAPDAASSDEPQWIWPSNGPVVSGYEEGKQKGLAIGGKEGDPVLAAGDGRVVYAGSGLRGYGNLVIIKHNGDYLTAYAHNKVLLVKEDQVVRRGQKIAEMGKTDAEQVKLHFEIRKQGKPIDPIKQLPAR